MYQRFENILDQKVTLRVHYDQDVRGKNLGREGLRIYSFFQGRLREHREDKHRFSCRAEEHPHQGIRIAPNHDDLTILKKIT